MTPEEPRAPSLLQALIPIAVLIFLLVLNVLHFGDHTLDGANQFALILASAVAGLIAISLGVTWDHVQKSMVKSISSAMPSILILLMIGALAGTWMLSGVVPSLIYYGLKVFHPKIFLFATVIIAGMVSLATGSSWSTVATIGIALIGVGQALGISPGLVAGAVISGAYFGDKMSPLSDTTNLAPAMAGTDLFTHIRYMTFTTVPTLILTLLIFLGIGFLYGSDAAIQDIAPVLEALSDSLMNTWQEIKDVFTLTMEFWAASSSSQMRDRFKANFRAMYQEYRLVVESLINAGIESGEFRPDINAGAVAAVLVGAWDALFLQAWFEDGFDPPTIAKDFIPIVITGLSRRSDDA